MMNIIFCKNNPHYVIARSVSDEAISNNSLCSIKTRLLRFARNDKRVQDLTKLKVLVLFCHTIHLREVKFMKRRRIGITISLSPEVAEEYEKLARKEAKNKSQLFREMFQLYKKFVLEQEFFELQRYGATLAREKGILTEEDVERLVFEDR